MSNNACRNKKAGNIKMVVMSICPKVVFSFGFLTSSLWFALSVVLVKGASAEAHIVSAKCKSRIDRSAAEQHVLRRSTPLEKTPYVFTLSDRTFLLNEYPPVEEFFMVSPPLSVNPRILKLYSDAKAKTLLSKQNAMLGFATRKFHKCDLEGFWDDYNKKIGLVFPVPAMKRKEGEESRDLRRFEERAGVFPTERKRKLSRKKDERWLEELRRCQYAENAHMCLLGDVFMEELQKEEKEMTFETTRQKKQFQKELEEYFETLFGDYAVNVLKCTERARELGYLGWPLRKKGWKVTLGGADH